MFKISQIVNWGKDKPPHRLEIEAVRSGIARHLRKRGIDCEEFLLNVRAFFDSSQTHHYRLAYRNAIAVCTGLDMTKAEDRKQVWARMAEERGIDRKTASKWVSGEIDPPVEKLMTHFNRLPKSCPQPSIEWIDTVRTGIARTLVYTSTFPPKLTNPELSGGELRQKAVLADCWAMLRRHEHYWSEQRRNLNQDAVDQVGYHFSDSLWIESEQIGWIFRSFEENPTETNFWFWPCTIVKYSTFADISSTSKRRLNPERWLWFDTDPRHQDLWRMPNG